MKLLVASLLLVVRPGAPSRRTHGPGTESLFLVAMPFAPSSGTHTVKDPRFNAQPPLTGTSPDEDGRCQRLSKEVW